MKKLYSYFFIFTFVIFSLGQSACSSTTTDVSDQDDFLADSDISVIITYIDAVDGSQTYTAEIPTTLPDIIYIEDKDTLVIDFFDYIDEDDNEFFEFVAYADFSASLFDDVDSIDFDQVVATYNFGVDGDSDFVQDTFDIDDDDIELSYTISEFLELVELDDCEEDADETCATITMTLDANLYDADDTVAGTIDITLTDFPVTAKSSN